MSKYTTNKDWFHQRLAVAGMSLRDLAKALDLDVSILSKTFSGDRKMTIERAALIAEKLDASVNEVLLASGIALGGESLSLSVDVAGWVDQGFKIHWGAVKGPKTAPYPRSGGHEIEALRFQTAGTPMEAMDGALIYVEKATGDKGVTALHVGRMCAVSMAAAKARGKNEKRNANGESGTWLVGILKHSYDRGTYNVITMAGEVLAESVEIDEARLVVWLKM